MGLLSATALCWKTDHTNKVYVILLIGCYIICLQNCCFVKTVVQKKDYSAVVLVI